jgi:hypothetical protein
MLPLSRWFNNRHAPAAASREQEMRTGVVRAVSMLSVMMGEQSLQ